MHFEGPRHLKNTFERISSTRFYQLKVKHASGFSSTNKGNRQPMMIRYWIVSNTYYQPDSAEPEQKGVEMWGTKYKFIVTLMHGIVAWWMEVLK